MSSNTVFKTKMNKMRAKIWFYYFTEELKTFDIINMITP